MTKLDRLISKRIGSRIALVVLIFFGLIALSESLDTWRFDVLSRSQGQAVAILAIIANAARWSIKVLPVTVLIGGIIGLLDLQAHRELVVIKAGGISIWRIMRAPIIILAIVSIIFSIFIDAKVTEINRSIMPALNTANVTIGSKNQVWLVQNSESGRYIVEGQKSSNMVYNLLKPTFFLPSDSEFTRVIADGAILTDGQWLLENATLIAPNKQQRTVKSYIIETNSSRQELKLRLASTDDFTLLELNSALTSGLSDPLAQSAAATRYAKLMALPALLVGTLLIAFAFTAGYRRTGSYGGVILAGIVLGFVVFVLTEMADRAGTAGVLNPTLAGWGPPLVSIVVGVTVLLYVEDGRA